MTTIEESVEDETGTLFRDVGGVSVVFSLPGKFVGRDGVEREGTGGVRIRSGGRSLRLGALQLAALFQLIKIDEEVQEVLKEQLENEKTALMGVTF